MKKRFLLLILVLFLPSSRIWAGMKKVPDLTKKTPTKTSPRAAELLEKLQKAWDATGSFGANFHQEVYATQMGSPPDETDGKIYVVKPDRLRWESLTDGSFQIINGDQMKYIRENKRRGTTTVDIFKDVRKAAGAKALNFLTGKAKFATLYVATLDKDKPKTASLKLTPKEDASETYIAEIDKDGYFLLSLTTETVDTKVVLKFSEIKRNIPIDAKLFEYKPKPSDIVHNH